MDFFDDILSFFRNLWWEITDSLLNLPRIQRYSIIGVASILVIATPAIIIFFAITGSHKPQFSSSNGNSQNTSTTQPSPSPNPDNTTSNGSSLTTTSKAKTGPATVSLTNNHYIIIDDTPPIHAGTLTTITSCLQILYHKLPTDGPVFMQWKLDNASWSGWHPLSLPCIFSNLANGTHTLSVQLKDTYQSVSSVVTRSFLLANANASQAIIHLSSGETISANNLCVQIFGDTTAGDLARDKLDNQAWSNFSSNATACFSNLTDGTHTISTQTQDGNGNDGPVITTPFTVDTNPSPADSSPTDTPTPTSAPINEQQQIDNLTPTPVTGQPVT